jgi:SNF2 family DNA or RNA helicase
MKTARQSLMSTFIQLCKCCNHPYLFDGIEPEPYTEGEHLVNSSGKTLILDRLLTYLKNKGHRVLIFSQMKRFLDIVHDILLLRGKFNFLNNFKYYSKFLGYNFEQLDGSTKTDERLRTVENFQRPDSDVFAFLLTTRAGGIGLNLTGADTIIFLDWDFNPQNDKQAAARCHRIGQKK